MVQQLPHRPFFLPLLKRFQELNGLKLQMVGLEAHTDLAWHNRLILQYRLFSVEAEISHQLQPQEGEGTERTCFATASRKYA